jgi:hypothetical protein
LQVNRQTLTLFGAADLQELQSRLSDVFRGDMLTTMLPEMLALWQGRLDYTNQTVNYALDGRRIDAHIRVRVLQGHEARWDRVLVSLEDVTQTVQARQERESIMLTAAPKEAPRKAASDGPPAAAAPAPAPTPAPAAPAAPVKQAAPAAPVSDVIKARIEPAVGPKTLGKIDLDAQKKPAEKPKAEAPPPPPAAPAPPAPAPPAPPA